MNKIKYIALLFLCVAAFACQDYSPSAPDACVKIEKMVNGELIEATDFKVGEQVFISSCGNADLYAVWTGDDGSDYSKKDERGTDSNGNTTWTNKGTGLSIKDGAQVVKLYKTAGSFKITLVATNTSTGDTDVEFIVATDEKTVTVTN